MSNLQENVLGDELEVAQFALRGKLITQTQLDECIAIAKQVSSAGLPRSVSQVLVEKNYLTQGQLNSILKQLGKPLAEIDTYEILSKLGEGGMGAVYKVRHKGDGKIYALKALKRDLAKDKEYLDRFSREVQISSVLSHPNIVSTVDYGVHKGVHYLVMEFIEGEPLNDIITKKGKLSEKESAAIIIQMADALSYANKHHLIHRDIKPANIIVTKDGYAKLCDLGIAKTVDAGMTLTQAGYSVGSPAYFSPEQVEGKKLDIRSDIYSLGVTLFNMITGTLPFEGETFHTISIKRLHETPPHPAKYSPGLSQRMSYIILKMMAREQILRYQTPEEIITALEPIAKREIRKDGKYPEPPDAVLDNQKDIASSKPMVESLSPSSKGILGMLLQQIGKLGDSKAKLMVGGVIGVVLLLMIIMILSSGRDSKVPPSQVTKDVNIHSKGVELPAKTNRLNVETGVKKESGAVAEAERLKKEADTARLELEQLRKEVNITKVDLEQAKAESERLQMAAKLKQLEKDAETARLEAERLKKESESAKAEVERLKEEAEQAKESDEKAEDYYNKGDEKYNNGDFEGAIADYNKAIELNSEYIEAYLYRGIAKMNMGNYERAIVDYDKAIELNPELAEAYANRAVAKCNLSDFKGAIADCNEALQLNQKSATVYATIGWAKLGLADYKGAISDCDKAIQMDTNEFGAYYVKGLAKQSLKDYQGAIANYSIAIKINPNLADAYNSRGTAKRELRDYRNALTDFDKAINLNPNLADAYANRGYVKKELRVYEEAIADWNKAIGLDPARKEELQPLIDEISEEK